MSQSLINDLEQSFKKQFPKGYFSAFMDQGLSGHQINVRCGLIGDLNDVSSKIRQNDPMFHQWLIHLSGDNLEKMEVSYLQGGLDLKPDAGSYLAIKGLKTGFRQFTGDEKKASKAFDKFFVKLRGLVDENNGSLYNREMYKDYI